MHRNMVRVDDTYIAFHGAISPLNAVQDPQLLIETMNKSDKIVS